jgi:thiamine biosynthesis lipoprotein
MGSDAHVIVVGAGPELVDHAAARIEQLESRWSRFRPDSEVCELNRHAGRPLSVSADTVLLVERAVDAWRLTGGSFDPTVLGDVLRAGYDRSFTDLVEAPHAGQSDLLVGCTDIVVAGSMVTLPAGTGFDAGGIGKGLAADLVLAELLEAGAAGACVNMGGDLRLAGESPEGDGWTVAVEHPWSTEPVVLLGLAAGAVTTSTTLKRSWLVKGQRRHHLIDPGTGEPSTSDLNLASIVTAEAWIGEVLAKAVLLRGSERAFDLIDPSVAEALTVDDHGIVRATPGLRAYLGDAEVPTSIGAPEPEGDRP